MDTNSDKKTEEILLQTMRRRKKEAISPSDALKSKLDKALATKRREKSFFTLQIPLYQSVAAAAIFFVLGFGTNFFRLAAPQQNATFDISNERLGISLREDTILQKMLVTVY